MKTITITVNITAQVPDNTELGEIHLRGVGAEDFEAMIHGVTDIKVLDFCTDSVTENEVETA